MNKIKDIISNISIRRQIFVLMITLFFIMVVSLYIILFTSMGKMLSQRENDDIKNQVNIMSNSLEDTYNYLPSVTRDWGAFNQTYRFVVDGFPEFLTWYLNDYPYTIYNLDFVTILDLNGDIVYERFYETSINNLTVGAIDLTGLYKQTSSPTIALFADNENLDINNTDEFSLSGFIKHDGNVLYISSCPIIRTNRTGPAVGSIIFGRIVSEKDIAAITTKNEIKTGILTIDELTLTGEEIEVLKTDNILVNMPNKSELMSYKTFKNIFNKNDLVLFAESPRTMYEEGLKNIQMALIIVAFCCTIIMVTIMQVLSEIVIKPISLNVAEVEKIDFNSDKMSISTVSKYKESKILNDAINNMLYEIKVGRDIIKEKSHSLFYTANHDSLTGLKNRLNCRNVLIDNIVDATNNSTIVGIILLDLDRFKNINDTMNHIIGDKFILAIAQRLQENVNSDVTIGRFGGDEFVIIFRNLKEEFMFHLYTDSIMYLFKNPFIVGDREMHIAASIGTCTFPTDGNDADTLFKNAEIAMYHAKKLGGNMSCRYKRELNKVLQRKLYIENRIRTAVNEGCKDFIPYFQPKALSENGEIHSCEALIRWQTDEGIISPCEFIPLAEETGLIVPLSKWMLKESCRCNKIFEANGIEHIVSVNISSQVLLHKDFLSMITESIEENEMSYTKLDIELTEETLLEDMTKVIDVLNTLHNLGITSSIDDFGTGYSSLSYLKKLPVDRIKIDRSFIIGLNDNVDSDRPIVNAIVAMGKTLKKIITAEGVEDCAQFAYLQSVKCDEIQGYFVSRPLPCDAYIKFYNDWEVDKKQRLLEVDAMNYSAQFESI